MSACKSCDAPIKWAKTEATGKLMPLDMTDDGKVARFDDGNVDFIGWADELRLVRVVAAGPDLFRSHFASCPEAGKHRRG